MIAGRDDDAWPLPDQAGHGGPIGHRIGHRRRRGALTGRGEPGGLLDVLLPLLRAVDRSTELRSPRPADRRSAAVVRAATPTRSPPARRAPQRGRRTPGPPSAIGCRSSTTARRPPPPARCAITRSQPGPSATPNPAAATAGGAISAASSRMTPTTRTPADSSPANPSRSPHRASRSLWAIDRPGLARSGRRSRPAAAARRHQPGPTGAVTPLVASTRAASTSGSVRS